MSNITVMAFSPRNIIGFLLEKGLQRGGGGVTGTPGPPSLRPCPLLLVITRLDKLVIKVNSGFKVR